MRMAVNLLNLPVEVHLEILDHLPSKKIQNLRGVCTDLKKIVDDNKITIANVKTERERKRIITHLNYHVLYTGDPTFMEKLSRWHEARGVWHCKRCRDSLNKLLAIHALPDSFEGPTAPDRMLGVLKAIAAEDYSYGLSSDPPASRDKTIAFLRRAMSANRLDIPSIEQICDEVVREATGLFLSEPHAETEHYTTTRPRFPLSELIIFEHDLHISPDENTATAATCTPFELSEWFGLPELPEGKIFAYCLGSSALYEGLQGALEHARNLSLLPDPMFKAAVMEDMYVF